MKKLLLYVALGTVLPIQAAHYNTELVIPYETAEVVVDFTEQPDLREKFKEVTGEYHPGTLHAFTHYPSGVGKCTIVIPRPEDWNDDETLSSLGHELLHCLGSKHDED